MIQRILKKMIEYDKGDAPRIQHLIKVYSFSHMLGVLEGMDDKSLKILDIASILHDIGIHKSEEIYGNSNGEHQEALGPEEARKLLEEFDLSEDEIDRVCYLIAHHHTYNEVDGLDYQILIEADFLVNSFEDKMNVEQIKHVRDKIFKTKSGIEALNRQFDL